MTAGRQSPHEGGLAYEDNPEFNQYLDDSTDEIEIRGLVYTASEVLFATDYNAYLDCLMDFEQERQTQLADTVIGTFPTPVAMNFRRSQKGAQNANQKVLYLRDTWEAVINTLFAIAMGELISRRPHCVLQLGNRTAARADLLSEKLTVRLSLLEEVLRVAEEADEPWAISEIASFDVVEQLRQLNRLRNTVSHTNTMPESQAEAFYLETIDLVMGVLRDVRALENARVVRFLSSRGNLALASCELFSGFQNERTIEDIEIPLTLIPTLAAYTQQPRILMVMGDHVVSLAPFVHFRESPDGTRTELCLFKRLKAGEMEYEVVGHSAVSEHGVVKVEEAEFADDIALLHSTIAGRSASFSGGFSAAVRRTGPGRGGAP